MNDDYDFDEGLYYDLYGEDEPYDGGNPPGHVDKSRCVFVFDDIHECGEWKFVDIAEDFSIKFVDIGEDFTIRFEDK